MTPEEELEAKIWTAIHRYGVTCGQANNFVTAILVAAKSYAAGDSNDLTAARRAVLDREGDHR